MDIGLLGAFLGGVLTLLSPCSVMLLPAFFSFAFTNPAKLVSRTLVFYLGLITTLVPLGILAGSLGAFVNQHRSLFITVASVIVIVLGLVMLSGIPLPGLQGTSGLESTSAISVYALGTVYGLAGVCAGPILGAVLAFAAMGGNALYGGVVLLVFAAGMAMPLLVLSLVWGRLPFVKKLVQPREVKVGRWSNTWTGIVSGLATVVIGVVLLATNGTSSLGGVLDASQQAQMESWIVHSTGGFPDIVVVIVVLGIAAAGLLLARRRKSDETSSSS